MPSARYRFAPGLELELEGPSGALRHFEREYAPAAVTGNGTAPALRATLGWGAETTAGGHKTVSWHADHGDPAYGPLALELGLRGRPRSFALSLVQGFHLEPALSVAAARAGYVLLPAAALEDGDGATIVLGRSRSGKSSVMTLALAAGRRVLGDDQVLVDGDGGVRTFPRRLRLYPDIRDTAPAAFRRLPAGDRRALAARGAARTLSRGWVAPSYAIPASAVGPEAPAEALPVRRLVMVDRSAEVHTAVTGPLDVEEVVALAADVLDEQRARLRAAAGAGWEEALSDAREREGALLRAALGGAQLERLRMPADWPAPRGVAALAHVVGL